MSQNQMVPFQSGGPINQSGQQPFNQPGQQPYGSPYQQVPVPVVAPKSAVAAGVLGIFLGGIGIHNFYVGRTGLGLAQLLITLFSIGFAAPLVAIWGFIEGILYLVGPSPRWNTDGRGMYLQR